MTDATTERLAGELRRGAAALVDLDHTGLPSDVRSFVRAVAGYTRIVLHSRDDIDAGLAVDLDRVGRLLLNDADLWRATAIGRPAIELATSACRWMLFATLDWLSDDPARTVSLTAAVDEAVSRVRAAVTAPDRAPDGWCAEPGCSRPAGCPQHARTPAGAR